MADYDGRQPGRLSLCVIGPNLSEPWKNGRCVDMASFLGYKKKQGPRQLYGRAAPGQGWCHFGEQLQVGWCALSKTSIIWNSQAGIERALVPLQPVTVCFVGFGPHWHGQSQEGPPSVAAAKR